MDVHFDVPEEFARLLAAEPGGIARVPLEALAAEGVRSGKLTVYQARQMLGIRSRYQMDGFPRLMACCCPIPCSRSSRTAIRRAHSQNASLN
jgi:hypothetical protein